MLRLLWYPGSRGFLLFFLANFATQTASFILFFYWHEALRAEKLNPLVKTVGILTLMPSASDRRFWLEDIFNCSTSHMIRWITYLWGCYWSKENDMFESCQVLSQLASEILNDLDNRLSFLSARRFNQHFASQMRILVVIKDWECVRRRNFNTDTLINFPIWLSTSVYW